MGVLMNENNRLGLFSLVMMAIVSVDSLRNLPIGAQYGFSLVTFYLLAGITFFIPLIWITSKLVTAYPTTGGSYVWIEKAFGSSSGFVAIWLQWVYNIIWFPTIFAFINATLGSLIAPGLENNQWYILFSSIGFFWALSFLHFFGINATRWMSVAGAIVGTLMPMFLMIGLAAYSLMTGHVSATPLTWQTLLPDVHSASNLGFFSNILFSLLGIEVIAMHAGNVVNPKGTYPKALMISGVLILLTLMCSSLSLCIILPADKIALMSGLMNVFDSFFKTYHIANASVVIGACIVIGGLAIASSWMVGLARGLQVAFCSANIFPWIQYSNKNHMPSRLLFLQAVIYSFLTCSYLLFPNINSSFWMLSALTAQFALLYYILLFCAAVKLLIQQSRSFINKCLIVVMAAAACLICVFGIVVGFLPPENIPFGSTLRYELIMVSCFFVMGFLPILIFKTLFRNYQVINVPA